MRPISRVIRVVTIMGMALAAAAPACADWTGKSEAGLVISSGNTETTTANAKLNLVRESGNWKNAFGLAGLYASDDTARTAQRWEALTQSDYNFTVKDFWFGAARYEDDAFGGFVYQVSVSSGVGRKFINTDRSKLTGTIGVGYKFIETEDSFDPLTGTLLEEGESSSEAVGRGTLELDHKITDTTSVLDKFVIEAGSDNTFIQNDLSLQVKINHALALAVGYGVRHNTDPPPGFERTDTLTTVNLVYELK